MVGRIFYNEGKHEQLAICVDTKGNQYHTSIFFVKVSAVEADHKGTTLEALDRGPKKPKN